MGSWRSELLRRHTLDLATTIWPHDQGIVTFALATASAVACLWMASFLFLQFSYSYLSSRRDASNSLLARGKSAMSIYRRKLKPILQKRAARSYCSLPPRRSACSTNHMQRRLGFFTLPVENNKAFFHLHVRVGCGDASADVCFGSKANIHPPSADVRFTPGSGHGSQRL